MFGLILYGAPPYGSCDPRVPNPNPDLFRRRPILSRGIEGSSARHSRETSCGSGRRLVDRLVLPPANFAAAVRSRARQRGAKVAPSGFEPLSPAPKASMLGHYTTGLRASPPGDDTKSSPDGANLPSVPPDDLSVDVSPGANRFYQNPPVPLRGGCRPGSELRGIRGELARV